MADIADGVVLDPMPLVDGVVSGVVAMADIKLDQKLAVLEAWCVMTDGILKCHANEAPLTSAISADAMGDKEELVRASDDGCGKVADSWD